jgi:hypothetical protein
MTSTNTHKSFIKILACPAVVEEKEMELERLSKRRCI